ncbi:hypothetical protein EBZ39_13120 [bacterium]|nr:hypothetical protein [bacterium]
MGTYSSATRQGAYEPFDLQVARGQVDGHSSVEIFGYSTAIGSTAQGPMWEGQTQSGGLYVPPASAAPLVLVSDSASDNTTRSVVIEGLGAGFVPIIETIALNGTTNVTTVNSFLRINQMSMLNSTNTGNITASISSTVYAKINAGAGQTQMSIYTVPAGYTFYLSYVQYDASIGFTSSNYMTAQEYNKVNSGTNNGLITLLSQSTFVQKQEVPFTVPVGHIEKTDIQFCVKANTGGPFTVSLYAGGILIKNPD